ncbi:hypothetical protein SLS62_008840 [Diatrype stigma]|uniref:PNPLA domain-containing protein n=1 Tax=Diatrype stigma TaxID=117547 RepID=A0AAN9UGA8_9PEZI
MSSPITTDLATTIAKVWEAARATTAAPRYFKSFHHEASQKTYIDGAVHHNNPVRIADSERKILWPDAEVPDIFLSIGTGSSIELERVRSIGSEHMPAAQKGLLSHVQHLYGILRSNLEQNLDCDRAWDDYISSVTTAFPKSFPHSRFLRINPDVGDIPALDEKDRMAELRIRVQQSQDEDRIHDVARQLIASTFYFELRSVSDLGMGGKTRLQGKIQCRIPDKTREIHELGKHLKQRMASEGEVKFFITEDGDTKPLIVVPLTAKVTDSMAREQVFNLGLISFSIGHRRLQTHINAHFGNVSMYPISGFPRPLVHGIGDSAPTPLATKFPVDSSSFRYKHGSRRHVWEPPDLQGVPSLNNLRQYASHPERPLGHGAVASESKNPTEADIQEPTTPTPTNPGVPPLRLDTGQSPAETGIPEVPTLRRRDAVRGAFKALLTPLRPKSTDLDPLSPITPGSLPPHLETWLQGYRRVQDNMVGNNVMLKAPQAELVASLLHYNVRPEEYVIYQQWINLLQPPVGTERGYWFPPVNSQSGDFARSAPEGTFYELEQPPESSDPQLSELADTGLIEIGSGY